MARAGVDSFSGFSLQVFYLKPKSLGSVHIGSKDPFSSPKIIANYLSDEEDKVAAINGLKIIRKLASRKPLKSLIAKEISPSSNVRSDADLLNFARETGQTCWHSVATCKMGEENKSVVDSNYGSMVYKIFVSRTPQSHLVWFHQTLTRQVSHR